MGELDERRTQKEVKKAKEKHIKEIMKGSNEKINQVKRKQNKLKIKVILQNRQVYIHHSVVQFFIKLSSMEFTRGVSQ